MTNPILNASDKSGIVGVTARKNPHSDLDLSLKIHPIRKDIIPLKDDEAIKNAVKNLILTNFYERPFNQNIGSGLKDLLFAPSDSITKIAIKDGIDNVLRLYEPRIRNVNVDVNYGDRDNSVTVNVSYIIQQSNKSAEAEVILRKIR